MKMHLDTSQTVLYSSGRLKTYSTALNHHISVLHDAVMAIQRAFDLFLPLFVMGENTPDAEKELDEAHVLAS